MAHLTLNTTEELKQILAGYRWAMHELSKPEFARIKTRTKNRLSAEITAIEQELRSREQNT